MARAMMLLFGLCMASWTAHAQPDAKQLAGPSIADAPSDIYRFERFEITSAERTYRVQLAVPLRTPPRAGFPVLYLLDGNAAFADLPKDQLTGELVLVAIGYATELRFDMDARAFDYTPPGGDEVDTLRGRKNGGADAFLSLLLTKIKPEVEARAKIDRKRQTLWGHSYGGLFALYTLMTRPDAFQSYVAADPSLWWGKGYITTLKARPTKARLFVLTGSGASSAPPPGVDPATVERMQKARASVPPGAARQLVARMKRAQLCELPDVPHGRLLALSLAPALEVASTARLDCQRLTSITTRP